MPHSSQSASCAKHSAVAEAREIARHLRRSGDPARATGMERYFKHEITALGVATPVLRTLIRERTRGLKKTWTPAAAVSVCDRLVREPELEIRIAGVLFLGAFHRTLTENVLADAERWLKTRLDNWALVDALCGCVLWPMLARLPAVEDALPRWSRAEGLWLRRASLVTLVSSARRGERLDLAYRLARSHFADPEDLMHKATGWLLREAGRTYRGRLERYLLRHGPAIPRTALRYAIEHFPPAERARLLRVTRS